MRKKKLENLYESFTKKKAAFILFLICALTGLFFISLSLGSARLSLEEVYKAFFRGLLPVSPLSPNMDSMAYTIIWFLRLPRVLMAIVAGAALAVAGAVLQVILRNPLASPYTLGVASSAAFGAALSIILGAGIAGFRHLVFINLPAIVINAFCFSMLSAFIIFWLSRIKGATAGTMVLAGIAMMYLFSAATSLLQYFGTEEQVTAVVFWMFGDLGKADWSNLAIVTLTIVLVFPVVLRWCWDYNALSLGDETAKSLGVNVEFLRLTSMILSALLTAVAVSFLGTIGFIGLLAPHITRMIIGGDHRFLLPTTCLIGSILLLGADTASRTILSPLVLPVGVLTSFLGVPLFIYLLLRGRREYW
ncbi:MAG: FecCD family ABC transporter permease [Candidatus Hecatellaceae archaeon]|nr:MAG: iron ABC transporter permease [Candidatus Hecatellales archaeon]